MKRIFLFAVLVAVSISARAAPYDPILRRLSVLGTAAQDQNIVQCTSVGAIFIDPSPLPSAPPLANCIELGAGIVISSGLLAADLTVVASKSSVDSVAADVATLLAAVAALESAVTDLQSDLSDLTTDVAGKYDTPTGTTSDYIRGDGSIAPFPEP